MNLIARHANGVAWGWTPPRDPERCALAMVSNRYGAARPVAPPMPRPARLGKGDVMVTDRIGPAALSLQVRSARNDLARPITRGVGTPPDAGVGEPAIDTLPALGIGCPLSAHSSESANATRQAVVRTHESVRLHRARFEESTSVRWDRIKAQVNWTTTRPIFWFDFAGARWGARWVGDGDYGLFGTSELHPSGKGFNLCGR